MYFHNIKLQSASNLVKMDCANVSKRKIAHKMIAVKYTAIKAVEGGKSKKDVAKKCGVPHNTLSTWILNESSINTQYKAVNSGASVAVRKKFRLRDHDFVDLALYRWAMERLSQVATIHEFFLKETALDFEKQLGL